MNDIIVRKAKVTDFDSILLLAKQLWDAEKPFDLNLTDNYYETDKGKEGLLKDIRSRKRIFLVAEVDSSIIGFVDGNIIKNEGIYREEVAYLSRLSVMDSYRSRGIGTKLIDEFKRISKEKDCSFIKINAFIDNTPAVNLYRKKGFRDYSMYFMLKI